MQQTICQKVIITFFTNNVSVQNLIYGPVLVKTKKMINNQQVTNVFNKLVGTSETIRLLSNNSINSKNSNNFKNPFNEWLAGLIDGNGSFLLSKKGYASLEIIMDNRDVHVLAQIKQKFRGSLKLRSGTKSIRYRLHDKKNLIILIHSINGLIRNPIRLLQLEKICNKQDINQKNSINLQYNNGWLAGFFDANGTIIINKINFQQIISISQKNSLLLNIIKEIYGGHVFISKNKYESFKWYIIKKSLILKILDYFKQNPPRSEKKNRLFLITEFFELKLLKAHLQPNYSIQGKRWHYFLEKWHKYKD